ncbi:hypothetical protein M409DRAFT_56722 [Zasmidium cellare ATCC 36951]|uniref:Uncharacterized protein n=1 Tax=Zasmidium cellare ATCC 36951 TaxID=1080233 RepID=A0A6A6CEV7_ZASCE|nr:uncharacterized protein M409DRAFT_56722 [Zasmidium cellare ATCC 36951]KAF2164462.1 hypothetical protein M409DRAFT_56722 [Zasmidium cellare ATCC 36951]
MCFAARVEVQGPGIAEHGKYRNAQQVQSSDVDERERRGSCWAQLKRDRRKLECWMMGIERAGVRQVEKEWHEWSLSMEPGTRPTRTIRPTMEEKWVRATRPRPRPCLAGRVCSSVRPVAASALAGLDMGGGRARWTWRKKCSPAGPQTAAV